MAHKQTCPYCKKPADAGAANCPHCGGLLVGKRPVKASSGSKDSCPRCGAPVNDGDIICVRCGVNLITGQQVAEAQTPAAPQGEPRGSMLPWMAGLGIAAVVVLLAGGLFYWLGGDPVSEAANLAKGENVQDAIDVLGTYLDKHPEDVRGQMLMGKLMWRTQRFDQASGAFLVASGEGLKDEDAALLAAVALYKAGGQEERLVALLERIAENHPSDLRVKRLLGLAHGAAKQYGRQTEVSKALAENGGGEDAYADWALGEALGGHPEAVGDIVSKAPGGGGMAEALLGVVAHMQGRNEEAIAHIGPALEQGTAADDMLQSLLAMAYLRAGEAAEASRLFAEARSGGQRNETARFFEGVCMERLGADIDAIQVYDEIVRGRGAYAGKAAIQAAGLYLSINDLREASESLLAAGQGAGESAKVSTLRGRLRMLEGEYDSAVDEFRSALRQNPDYAPAHLEMGLMYLAQGVPSEGLRELERFLTLAKKQGGGTAVNEVELLTEELRKTLTSQGE